MARMRLNGMQELTRGLDQRARGANRDVQNIIRKHGASMNRRMAKNAPVDTGNLRRSIQLNLTNNGFTATVRPNANYASYVEYGTRYIYPSPYVRPAFYAEQELVIQAFRNMMR
ncbi:HK97-gp10 family putative phage morphogenesis protein [Natribacillus halophilus]|uniref:Phage protein, HK97 gp10 family n=1 Tax=Natribacillus halophilus TaxID=549003 RepID=A0A1G8RTT4_9BACI|nr:phage protein, HK97 gp10 family [Natribacillus halophilus]